tara:strand:- start:28938 stop:29801 length:864 start_codon:yes stop_codon:yes gene_type:complete
MRGAWELGHEIYHALFSDLFFQQELMVSTSKLDLLDGNADSIDQAICSHANEKLAVDEFDYVWVRTDPPFDKNYLYASIYLSQLKKAMVINRPQALRDYNEKLAILNYPKHIPWSITLSDAKPLITILESKKGRFVLKPLDGFAGRGIEFLSTNDKNWKESAKQIMQKNPHGMMVQEYLAAAKDGDKRVLLWKGEALGAILRRHPIGEVHNLDAGGQALPTKISDTEMQVVQDLKESFVRDGLYFVGLDFIGEKLTEINVTSPTGLQELCRFEKRDFHIEIMQSLPS